MISTFFGKVARQLGYLSRREIDYHLVKPRDALFFITYRCTSGCKTCSMWQRRQTGEELSLAEWQRTVDMCYGLGVKYIELFGGDALLRKEVVIPLISHIKKYPIEADLVTNCNLMDRATAEGLVQAGLDDLWLSVDGVGESQDLVRGKDGSYDKVLNCIEAVKRARGEKKRPLLHCNTTISKFNVDAFEKVLSFAEAVGLDLMHLEYAGEFLPEMVDHASINGIRPNPYYIFQGDSILVDQAQARTLKRKVRELKKEARGMRIALMTENVDCLKARNLVTGRFGNKKCYVARFKVTVDPYGNVLPCPFFGDYHLGNIRNEDLARIWRNEKHLSFIRNLGKIWSGFCRHCILGVQRNRTFRQLLLERTYRFMRNPRRWFGSVR
ncbi:MAG: radical SAM protein [Candidatus Eisenbacteria bacterium]|nr:radical SAM protein [Candidatus Eisenbacteria bacterium]